jgi:chaperonin GroEL (HSP60 family)
MTPKKFDSTRLPLRHERVPELEHSRVLREGSVTKTGKDALHENITVAKVMVEFVKGLLGPRRMSKIILSQDGRYTSTFVTTDLKTILKNVKLEHPIAQLMAGAALSLSKEKGDGSVSTIILTGKILEECEKLINDGIHPNIIREGLILSYKKAIEASDKLGFDLKQDITEIVRLQVHNVLTGKLPYQDREHIAALISDAARILNLKNVPDSEGTDIVDVKKIKGKSVADSFLIDGLALYRELPNMYMQKRIENAKIALIRGELITPKKLTRYYDMKFEFSKVQHFRDFKNDEFRYLKSVTDKILSVGANVIMLEKGVDNRISDYIAKQDILLIRRFPPPEVDRVAKATGAFAATSIRDLDASCLGWAKVVEHKKIGGEPWLLIWGCQNPKTVDIVLRGTSIYLLDDIERIIKGAVSVTRTLAKDQRLVFGGGAFEEEVALCLRNYALEIADKRQLIIEAVAKAFESIPLELAKSAGMNELDALTGLRAKHNESDTSVGINVINSQLEDMKEIKVFDSLAVKKALIEAVFGTALTVIQIDSYIHCKELPEPEKYYAQRIEKTKGMKVEEEA